MAAITTEGIYAITPSTPGVEDIIESIVLIHASCILVDKMLLGFMPPLSHRQMAESWHSLLQETQVGEKQHQYQKSRLILVSVSKVADRQSVPDGSGSDSPFEGHPWPILDAGNGNSNSSNNNDDQLEISGSVSLFCPESQTGPFRGLVERLMVSPWHRKRGLASRLMAELERRALARGRWRLMLDTTAGSAADVVVYPKLGYERYGVVTDYGISPRDGATLVDETFFTKDLRGGGA